MMSKGEIFATGLNLNFFDSPEFEAETENSEENARIIARNVLRVLMMGWQDNWQDLASKRVLNAVFVKRDHELMRAMRLAFQEGLDSIFLQLKDRVFNEKQLNQAQLFISNCMSLLPYSDPNPYESFTIPQFIDGYWQQIEYKVTPIELTPTKGFSKLFISDDDRVFAYGLTPLTDSKAEPHLIFMGTTYPAGQGFKTDLDTDLEGFTTPGSFLYEHGRDKIIEWVDEQNRQGKNPYVCGQSLGGSLALIAATDLGDKLSCVVVLNPPGLYEPLLYDSAYDHWDDIVSEGLNPPVFIQKQGKDVVSKYGKWKLEWRILQVNPPQSKQGPNGFADHAVVYTAFKESEVVSVDTNEDNEERKSRNFWTYTLLRALGYYSIILPYHFVVIPSVRFVLNNKLATGLIFLFVLASIFLPPVLPAAAAIVLFTAVLIPITIFFAFKLYDAMKTILGWNEVNPPACQDPDLQRNPQLDIYANKSTKSYTYSEIRQYYYAKRCILKGKTYLPEDNNEKNHKKRENLTYAKDSKHADEEHGVTTSKAKIYDMKQTLQLLERFGLKAPTAANSELKAALSEQHEAYRLGKQTPGMDMV